MAGLRTDIWVSALIRRAELAGAFATVIARGDEVAGDVVVKVCPRAGRARLYAPSPGEDGARVWIDPLGGYAPEAEADAYLQRRRDRDPDVWIVEIEDRDGRSFIAGEAVR